MEIGKMIAKLRKAKGLNQRDFANFLGVSNGAIGMWETGKRQPDLDTIEKIASFFNVTVDYLLGREDSLGQGLNKGNIEERGLDGSGITDILGYTDDEEKIITFSNKLSYQIDCNSSKIADVANGIGVPERVILKWLDGTDNSYTNYYDKLSDYFGTGLRYWTCPNAISPTIEPNIEEYLLIMAYRNYQSNGTLDDEYYGSLEHYFPGIDVINNISEKKFLSVIRQLDEDNMDILLGKAKELLKEQRYEESVAADNLPKRTGTDSLGK
mgnify:CR=1 FL=1